MFSKAVVCTDLSTGADCLVDCAGSLRVLGVREAVLTHVVDVFRDSDSESADGLEAEQAFSRQVAHLEENGLSVRVESHVGHPAFSLDEVRRRNEASLVVVGVEREGLFGSWNAIAAPDIFLLSDVPVLVTMHSHDAVACSEGCAGILRHVLFCTDFSEAAERAFARVVGLVALGARSITLLHVQESEDRLALLERTARGPSQSDVVRMQRLRERLLVAGALDVEPRIVEGDPSAVVSRYGSSGDYSLVVIGSRGRRHGYSTSLGDVGVRLVRETHTPVLVVPDSRQADVPLGVV